MKSVKPGRGPSKLSGIMGIFVALFGVFWIIMAVAGGTWFMAPFGIIFVIMAITGAVYNLKNATGDERYSAFDIVDSDEEGDPLNRRYGRKKDDFIVTGAYAEAEKQKYDYCPFCGKRLESDFTYCPHCGSKMP